MLPALPNVHQIQALSLIAETAALSNFLKSNAPLQNVNQRKADAFFVIMMGYECGLPPMTALQQINVVDGKLVMSAQSLVSLARQRGVEFDMPDPATVKSGATVKIKRPGGEWKSFTFTLDMAKLQQLDGKKNWQKMPQLMLIWRAVSMALRFEAPDLIGPAYAPEEINPDLEVNEDGELVTALTANVQTITAPALPKPAPDPKREAWRVFFDEWRAKGATDEIILQVLEVARASEFTGTMDEAHNRLKTWEKSTLLEAAHDIEPTNYPPDSPFHKVIEFPQ